MFVEQILDFMMIKMTNNGCKRCPPASATGISLWLRGQNFLISLQECRLRRRRRPVSLLTSTSGIYILVTLHSPVLSQSSLAFPQSRRELVECSQVCRTRKLDVTIHIAVVGESQWQVTVRRWQMISDEFSSCLSPWLVWRFGWMRCRFSGGKCTLSVFVGLFWQPF